MATEVAEQFPTNLLAMASEGNKSMKSQEYASLRHAIPKSKISRAILHDNTSRDRVLETQMRHLDQRCNRFRLTQEQNIRTFMYIQKRKAGKWRAKDEARLKAMNLPMLNENVVQRPVGAQVVYRNPRYSLGASTPIYVPLREQMATSRERTEIVKFETQAFLAKLPTTIDIPKSKMKWYDSYRGKSRLKDHNAVTDDRFQKLERTLIPDSADSAIDDSTGEVGNVSLRRSKTDIAPKPRTSIYQRSQVEFPVILPRRFTPVKKTKSSSLSILPKENGIPDDPTSTENEQKSGNQKGRKNKILNDVKSKSLKDLSKNYGFLSSMSNLAIVDKTPRGTLKSSGLFGLDKSNSMFERERTELPGTSTDTENDGENGSFYVPTLQLYFARKNNNTA